MADQKPVKVFISYSHDSSEHKTWVLNLASELRSNGVDVILDQWDIKLGGDVVKFMEQSVSQSDRVLVICTEQYVRKADEGKGGSGYEATIITSELVRGLDTCKFIPIIRQSSNRKLLPRSLSTRLYVDLSDEKNHASEFERLLRELHDVPLFRKPPLGESPFHKPGQVFRDTLKDGSRGPEMVVIAAGRFRMGDLQGVGLDREKSPHWVKIAKFAMGKYPVTFEEYDRYARAAGRELPGDRGWGQGNRPVINVSWHDAVAYAKWLSGESGKRYRLPTEAEWEYAARAGTETNYWWGDEVERNRANCDGCGSQWDKMRTAPVDSFVPNPFGLYDMLGNVYEWVQDVWHDNYDDALDDGSAWLTGGDSGQRVLRGGYWFDSPWFLRAAFRNRSSPDYRDFDHGFRLAQDV